MPEVAATYSALGVSQALAGNVADAIGYFRRAVAIDPNHAPSQWHLGTALAQQGRLEEALVHLSRSLALDPDNPGAANDLAVVQRLLGR